MKKQFTQQNKILILVCLIFIIPVFVYVLFALGNTSVKTEQKSVQQKTTEIKEQPKEEAPPIDSPVESTKEAPKTQAPTEQKQTSKKESSVITNSAPQLSIEIANKIELSMTVDEVKNIIGAGTFDSALKAGGTLTGLTLRIPNTDGGIIIGFNDEKVSTITRTYELPKYSKDKYNNLKKGMTLKDVKVNFGPAAIENGGKGTAVLIYKYTVGEETRDLVVAFDQNDKVLVVS